ncbi:MAG: outer membrane protein transport protein [Holophaga sp.]|nr:outer membrane protein transport protein [Holophaga sp.]
MGTLGLLAGLGAPQLAAQSWSLPASDPVGIARSGTGVAYGNNLEAVGLNPALLATLRDERSAYLALGMEMTATNATLQANSSTVMYGNDRNRFLPGLGVAWRISPTRVLGFRVDEPFLRHAEMPLQYTGRFQGQAIDLHTHRYEAQLGWAATPNWAFGASLGVTQIQYSWDNMVRTVITNPSAGANDARLGLMESDLHQEGSRIAPSYSVGFRWAPNSRWTVGGSYVGPIKATLPLHASYGSNPPSYYALSGYGAAPVGTSASVKSGTQYQAGSGGITLPGKLTFGVRQRVNQVFTWEADLRYNLGSQMELPGYPSAVPAGGSPVTGAGESRDFRNGFGLSIMGELAFAKNWVARLGAALEPGLLPSSQVEPLVGGARSSGLSGGIGHRMFGGEVNVGYQYRQAQNSDVQNLDGAWSAAKNYYTNPGSTTRVGGMGHLWSVGYKRTF